MVHQDAGTEQHFFLDFPGLVEGALKQAEDAFYGEPSYVEGVVSAAARLLHGIAWRQAFRDGNRRSALFVTRRFLDANGLGYVSPFGHDDHIVARYLNGTVESKGARYPYEQYRALLHRRVLNRRRIG